MREVPQDRLKVQGLSTEAVQVKAEGNLVVQLLESIAQTLCLDTKERVSAILEIDQCHHKMITRNQATKLSQDREGTLIVIELGIETMEKEIEKAQETEIEEESVLQELELKRMMTFM